MHRNVECEHKGPYVAVKLISTACNTLLGCKINQSMPRIMATIWDVQEQKNHP